MDGDLMYELCRRYGWTPGDVLALTPAELFMLVSLLRDET